MLGINDPWIIIAYLSSIVCAIVCVAYGAYNWNRGGENEALEMSEEAKWEKDDILITENV